VLARAAFWHSLAEVAPINAGDFLISYGGGFVRRGLIGELLFRLPFVTNMHRAEIAIKTLSLVAYCASFAMFVSIVTPTTQSRPVTMLIALQPFLFGFPVLTGQWIKADLILLLGFYLCLRWMLMASGPRPLAANLVSIVAILIHEAFGLTMLPLLIVIAASKDDPTRRPWTGALPRAAARFAPSIATLLAVAAFPGDASVGRGIQSAWANKGIVIPDVAPALFGLTHQNVWRMGFDVARGGYSDKPIFFLFWGIVIAVSGALVSLAPGLGRARGAPDEAAAYDWHSARESAAVVGLAAVAFAPLFLMATDFGRWVFLWLSAAAAIAFSPLRHDLVEFVDRALPRALSTAFRDSNEQILRPRSGGATSRSWCIGLLACSLFCLPVPAYAMEGCCTLQFVLSFSMISRVVRLLLGN
jgi:hypothetical protein